MTFNLLLPASYDVEADPRPGQGPGDLPRAGSPITAFSLVLSKRRLREADYDELRRIIREEDPPRPSTRISTMGDTATTVAVHRKTEPRKLCRLLRGELDWIVMKAMEKNRTRRYETAIGLARDVERYLRHEPVAACPPSALYRLRKMVSRNKAASASTLAVFVGLVGGLALAT